MHPRPQATKRARVSFGPDLAVTTETLITKRGSATGPQRGGWGGHWPTRTEIPQLTTGKGKETMEDPVDLQLIPDVYQPASKRHAGPRHTGDSCHNLGGGSGITGAASISDRLLPQRAQEPIATTCKPKTHHLIEILSANLVLHVRTKNLP